METTLVSETLEPKYGHQDAKTRHTITLLSALFASLSTAAFAYE
jgi:hypothetical protein